MKFFENGGKVYGVFQTSSDLVPKTGFHIPGKMGGVWFGPIRLIGDVEIDMGPLRRFNSELWGKILEFQDGTVFLMAPWMKRCFFIKIIGHGLLKLTLDGTPSWLSERKGWEGEIKVKDWEIITDDGIYLLDVRGGDIRIQNKMIEVKVDGETTIKIWQERCGDFHKEKERKEIFFQRAAANCNWIKRFLMEMYFDSGYGKGLMAGLEEFPWWFNVDLFFTVPVLLSEGLDWIVKDTLWTLLENMKTLPPHEVVSSGVANDVFNEFEVFTTISTIALYTKETGDDTFIPHLKHVVKVAERLILNGLVGKGMVEVRDYEGRVLDLESFAYKALRDLKELEDRMGIDMVEVLRERLKIFEEDFIRDWYDPKRGLFKGPVHFTQVIPLYFGLVPESIGRTVLRTLYKIGMIVKRGLKHSLRVTERGGLYGEKSENVWWLANALLKGANIRYGNILNLSFLEKLFENDLKRTGYPPEIVGGSEGCFAQSWSVLFPMATVFFN